MNERITEHDEFLLSRLLDGDLPAEEAAALRARMEREPELNAAFEAYRKIDEALVSRRADRVHVDYKAFHAQVMQRVERGADAVASSRSRILRFPGWFKVGLPLAAAAAIALVVTLQDRSMKPGQQDDDAASSRIARNEGDQGKEGTRVVQITKPRSQDRETGTIMVQFNRPSGVIPTEPNVVRVSFQRSETLARQMEQEDDDERSRPSIAAAAPVGSEPKVIMIDQDFSAL